MRLGKRYSPERLEAACRRALLLGACSYKSMESILHKGARAAAVAAVARRHRESPPSEYPWSPLL